MYTLEKLENIGNDISVLLFMPLKYNNQILTFTKWNSTGDINK